MSWHSRHFLLSLLLLGALLLAHPAAARGNATSGIYPGTIKDVCVGDTIFVGEKGLNLTPLTPYASGTVIALFRFPQNDPGKPNPDQKIPVPDSRNFLVDSDQVKANYGIWFPVLSDGSVLAASPIYIQGNNQDYPTDIVITGSKNWMIADGSDPATLSISIRHNGVSQITKPAIISLAVSSPWALSDTTLTTTSGDAQTTFLPTTKSGSAVIIVSVSVPGVTTAPVTTTYIQKIDAGNPSSAITLYPMTATVGTVAPIWVRVTDKYGNPVTSARKPMNVIFYALGSGTSAFLDGAGNRVKPTMTALLNETGFAQVNYVVSTFQGDNLIFITPPDPLRFQIIDILGIGNGKPHSITQVTIPEGDPPLILANGEARAAITYFLYDEWNNPSTDQALTITTDAGEKRTFITNQEGQVTVFYGPKLQAAFYTLTATADENPEVQISQTLQFGSLDPNDMLLTASPQTMASLDVHSMDGKAGSSAQIIGKVIDGKGNPVNGQTVTFSIVKDIGTTTLNRSAAISAPGGIPITDAGIPVPVVSDQNGQAILLFTPGAFPRPDGPDAASYNATASGTTNISAVWVGPNGTVTRYIDVNYKNYPYLSVYAEVRPKTVQVGNQVDVSVQLKGDGWALQQKPIDVVLCMDRSGSMLINESITDGTLTIESVNDRMVDAMNAAKLFVDKTSSTDRIGLISFGIAGNTTYPYAVLLPTSAYGSTNASGIAVDINAWRAGKDYNCTLGQPCDDSMKLTSDKTAFVTSTYKGHGLTGRYYKPNGVSWGTYNESSLTYSKDQVKDAIDSMVPDGLTPMRAGIYESVKQITTDPNYRNDSVHAIVLLTDGTWNIGGDPRGLRTVSGISTSNLSEIGRGSVITWAKDNHIKIFTIALIGKVQSNDMVNESELQAYADETGGKYHRAEDSTQLAGIYTEIAGELREDASVNTTLSLDFTSVDVVNGSASGTYAGKDVFNYTYIPGRSTHVTVINKSVYSFNYNNTGDWEKGSFSFNPGTIKLNDLWMVNFTLNSSMPGNIRLLSARSSQVSINGGEENVSIPDTYITTIPRGTEKGPEGITFNITNVKREGDKTNTQVAQIGWDRIYDGTDPTILYRFYLAPPYSQAYAEKGEFTMDKNVSHLVYNLVITGLKPGVYSVKVEGIVRDADTASGFGTLEIMGPSQETQILIR